MKFLKCIWTVINSNEAAEIAMLGTLLGIAFCVGNVIVGFLPKMNSKNWVDWVWRQYRSYKYFILLDTELTDWDDISTAAEQINAERRGLAYVTTV